MRFRFDPDHDLSWGYYSCELCDSRFFDDKTPIHNSSCRSVNGESIFYCFGRKELRKVVETGRSVYSSLKRSDLERDFPELLEGLVS